MIPAASNCIELMPQARFEMNQRRAQSKVAHLWDLLDAVTDPEIPVMSIWELGVLQDVCVTHNQGSPAVTVVITPTYSGCPALSVMSQDITSALAKAGYENVRVEIRLAPAWTTDWLTGATKNKLHNYGIAPPDSTACPQCGSECTKLISEFASTACKSLYRCLACQEPFDHFKSI